MAGRDGRFPPREGLGFQATVHRGRGRGLECVPAGHARFGQVQDGLQVQWQGAQRRDHRLSGERLTWDEVCRAWLVFASQFRIRQDGTVDRSGMLAIDKYRITSCRPGFEPIFVASGVGAPSSLQVSDNLSSGSTSGTVEVTTSMTCDPQGNCRTKLIPLTVSLSANAPVDFQRGRVVTKFDECRIVERFNDRTRTAEGTAHG